MSMGEDIKGALLEEQKRERGRSEDTNIIKQTRDRQPHPQKRSTEEEEYFGEKLVGAIVTVHSVGVRCRKQKNSSYATLNS
jgi:hypothetical protein